MLKNTTFELLDHHHELNQKKMILKDFFILKIDSLVKVMINSVIFLIVYIDFSYLTLLEKMISMKKNIVFTNI